MAVNYRFQVSCYLNLRNELRSHISVNGMREKRFAVFTSLSQNYVTNELVN